MYEKPWFARECDRKTAEELLFHANQVGSLMKLCTFLTSSMTFALPPCWFLLQDGAFMVRKSSRQDTNQPYTLVVYYKGRVYNIPIRLIHTHTRQQYALGREKKGEEVHLYILFICFSRCTAMSIITADGGILTSNIILNTVC